MLVFDRPVEAAFPTHVGVNRASLAAVGGRRRIPHARGGEPASRQRSAHPHRIPHARGGEPTVNGVAYVRLTAFPTHVGVNRSDTR